MKLTRNRMRLGLLRKGKVFLTLPLSTKLLYMEAYVLLGWARILKLLPFSKVAPSLGEYMKETPYTIVEEASPILIHVSRAVRTMSRFTLWESRCLVMAIAAMKMLERRGISSTLYMGTAKEEDGRLVAHAWLRSGNKTLTGAEGKERYAIVGMFANEAVKASEVKTRGVCHPPQYDKNNKKVP